MKKFFIVIGILFVIALLVSILAGNITWKNVKDTGVTLKESFLKVSKSVSETTGKIKDNIQEKIKDTREYWKKKREEK